MDNESQSKCEGLVSYAECLHTLNKMKKNKSPGMDGITTEFYQAFWPFLGNLLVDVFNQSYELGKLPDSQRKSVMSLIFKRGDEDDISNYRPISLTNTDYRILAFTLAERMQKVLGGIISNDQTAYIKGKCMGTNIRLVSDVIDYYDILNKSGILLMLDFQKTFDSLDWNFLFKTLNFFNFGQSFTKWIDVICHKPEACVKNNGYLSDFFDISRGVRQGCPISALLFLLCVEILGIKIRTNNLLQGFHFDHGQNPIKLAQYADDCILFINNKNEICCALAILEKYGQFSGLLLNIKKCEALWLGKDKALQPGCTLFGIKWPEQIRCLGVYLDHNKQINDLKNFEEKVNSIEAILKRWEKRELSLFGRVLILKTFALSKLVLPASLMCVPLHIVKRVDTLCYKFLWKSKDKIKRLKVIQSLENGGLNMIDTKSFFDSLHARWITRILETDADVNNWAQVPRLLLGSVHVDGYNMRFNFDESVCFPQVESLLSFYKNAVQCFNKAYVTDESTFEKSVLNQPLWGNKYITYYVGRRKNVLFLRNRIRSGIRVVGDLPFRNGVLDENEMYNMLDNKTNMYCEVMLVKTALYQYRMNIVNGNKESVVQIRPLKSKEYYNVYIQQLACSASITPITKYLDSHCNDNDDFFAFSKKVVLENAIKLKEFNFKVLHGILACNKNLKIWKIRLDDRCDVCTQIQTIEHLLFGCIM